MKTQVAFALALTLSFTGIVGNHAEAARSKPDLIVSAVSAPSPASPDATIVVSGTVKNQGKAGSKAFGVAYYLSTNPSSTTGAAMLGTGNISNLAAGASAALVTSFTVPGSTASGTFYVVAVADSTKVISESNESNNSRASGAVVIQPAVSIQASAQMTVWVVDSLTRVQPTDPPGTSTAATIKAARNEYEAFQVIIQAPSSQALSNVNVSVSDLVGPGTIAKSNLTLYRAHYIRVSVPSENQKEGVKSPNPPGDWPDALIPATVPGGTYPSFPFSLAAGTNQPVWVEVYVPKGTLAGTYNGTVTVTGNGVPTATSPLTLTVWGFTLPDKPTLASEFWGYDLSLSIDYQYSTGADRTTLRNNIYSDLRRHRIGFGETGTSNSFPNATLDATLQQQAKIQASWNMTDAKLQELINAYRATQLYAQHDDEPKSQAEVDAINDPNSELQRYRNAGVPELLTIADPVAWSANVDIYVAAHYMLDPDLFYWSKGQTLQQLIGAGKTGWSYTAGLNTNKTPNWLLDFDLINFRIVPWLDRSTGLTGLLYWTPVNWCAGDPWTNAGSSTNPCNAYTNHNMEGVLYYPGSAVGNPNAAIPSARLKAVRDGVEDYDYLTLLAQLGDPALATTLSATLAPTWNNWSHDPALLNAARTQAATRIVQLGGN